MLNALREKTQGLMGIALLVILVVPFVLWGVSSYFEGSQTVYVARGHGLRITGAEFENTLAQQRAALEHAYGKNLNPTLLAGRTFKKAVLESLINKTLLIEDAKKAGFVVNPIGVAEEIRHIPAFRVKGRFSASRYQELLQAQGLTTAGFEKRVRDLTLLNQVKAGLLASAFVPAPVLVDMARLLGQKRSIAYVLLSPRVHASTRITAQDIQSYYKTQAALFRTPQRIRIAYVVLSPQTLMRTMHGHVGMGALQTAYRDHIQQFTHPETRLVSHIMIALPRHPSAAERSAARAKLLAIRAKILHGASFAALARRDSQDPTSAAQGGRLGFVAESDLSKPVGTAAFALPLNHVSQPIVGASGIHLLLVTAIHAASVVPFADVSGELTRMVLAKRAHRRLYHLSERLRNAAYEHPHSVAPAAKKLGLTVHESGWFSRTSGTGMAALPQVVKAVFAPKVLAGERNSHAVAIGQDGLLVAHVIGRKPPGIAPLTAALQASIKKTLLERAAQKQVAKQADILRTELLKGAALATVARQMHLVVVKPAPFERVAPGLPDALIQAVFKTPLAAAGASVGSVALSRGRQAVFVLKGVVYGKVDPSSARFIKLERSLISDTGVETYLAYMKSLRLRAHVHITGSAL